MKFKQQRRSSDKNSIKQKGTNAPNSARADSCSVGDWTGQIKKACTRSTASMIELAGVVATAKRQSLSSHGQWKQVCKSLPFSRRKADMLATIGEKFATLAEAALEHLPSAS